MSDYNRGAKRSYEDEPQDIRRDNYDNNRTFNRPKRPVWKQAQIRFRRGLATIGDDTDEDVYDHISRVVQNIPKDMFLPEIELSNKKYVFVLCKEQSFKIPLVATTIMSAAAIEPKVGQAILEELNQSIKDALQGSLWNDLKLYLRFAACLQPGLLDSDSLLSFVDKLTGILPTISDQTLLKQVSYVILMTLPYIVLGHRSEETVAKVSEFYKSITELPFTDVSSDSLNYPYVDYPESEEKTYQSPAVDIFQSLLEQLKEVDQNQWNVEILPAPWSAEQVKLSDSVFKLDEIELPEVGDMKPSEGHVSKYGEFVFRLFSPQPIETTPQFEQFACTLLRDNAVDLLDNLDFNRMEVARLITSLDLFFRPSFFVPPATTLDAISPEGPTWKIEDFVTDTVFNQLFRLPTPVLPPVYYHSVLIELCMLAPVAIAPVFGRAIRNIFNNLHQFDVDIFMRYISWFGHHLSNFTYTWRWTEWANALDLPEFHPRRLAIREIIAKEVRLSFPQRILETLPPDFTSFVVDGGDVEFKYGKDDYKYHEQGQKVLQGIKERKEAAEMKEVFEEVKQQLVDETSPETLLIQILVCSVCFLGSRSLSHASRCIERSLSSLMAVIGTGKESRVTAIDSIMKFWKDSPGVGVQIVEKFAAFNLIDAVDIFYWIFGHSSSDYQYDEVRHAQLYESMLIGSLNIWELIVRLLNAVIRTGKEGQFLEIMSYIIQDSDKALKEEEDEWVKWWKLNQARSLIRRYRETLSSIKPKIQELDLSSDELKGLLEKV
ncbi:hypothetical protein CANCADRAFT_2032 [Tortispora caseinolytica NRRL Y-17796]|uniref:MIF4G domain-containing protein n=1 Tax=Tortispora caseinolytica NRRL Y-17796 TaxID=767744 RepID=A0A1E4TEV2_9ASCO|nr:hypothetical protein CANCADRAFT_2032 [Tortispora caseinolytica NRRL Y-17796]